MSLVTPDDIQGGDWSSIAKDTASARRRHGTFDDVDDLRAFWSEDGTRAFLFRTGAAGFESKAYELQVALTLDLGAEAPVWRAGGSTAPEVATLRFTLQDSAS